MSFWKIHVSFPSSFASIFSVMKHNSLNFFSSNIIYFFQKEPFKMQMFQSKFVKFLMSILKRQVNSSSNFAFYFIVVTYNTSGNFKLIHFLFWMKTSHQSPNVKTFECSGENLPYSPCHFPNYKSFFLQIFASHFSVIKDNSSVLFQVKPCILCTKELIKVKFLKIWSAQV